MFSIAVCDTNTTDIAVTERMIKRWFADNSGISGDVTLFGRGPSLLQAVEGGERFDLFLLESEPEGMQLCRRLREINSEALIVLVTGSDSYAMEAYRLHVLRYITKPADESELRSALNLAYCLYMARPSVTIFIKGVGEVIPVNADEIMYVENNIRVMTYNLSDGKTVRGTRRNISFEAAMAPLSSACFIQTHKSYFVNMRYISALRSDSVLMVDGREIPISRKNLASVRRDYMAFMRHKKV